MHRITTWVARKPAARLAALLMASLLLAACGPKVTPTRAAPTAKPAATGGAGPSSAPRPTPTVAVAKVGTALEWYPVAAQAAASWQGDAVLSAVTGNNITADGGSRACDGRAEQWSYAFISVAAEKRLSVYVRAGAVSSKADTALTYMGASPPLPAQVLQYYSGLYPAADWQVDSTLAAETTTKAFKDKYNVEPASMSYVLFNSKYLDSVKNTATNWMRWVVSCDPEKYPLQVTLDARSGEVKSRP